MRRHLAALVAVGGLLTGGLTIAGPATPAFAIGCGTVVDHDWQAFNWTHGSPYDVGGVRSGIKFRLDGANCDYSLLTKQTQSVWIAVIGNDLSGKSIAQMGVIKQYNTIGIT
ncbi:MAG: hypothetical protein ACR2FU_01750 [Streptosporangiaceae bacterium]